MTKLRNRLLVTLVLAAVLLAALGTGVVSARTLQRRNPSLGGTVTTPRPGTGWYSGEPDPSGQGAPCPPKVDKPAMIVPAPGLWVAQWWIQWRTQSSNAGRRSGR
jgi:hypothetical protein